MRHLREVHPEAYGRVEAWRDGRGDGDEETEIEQ